MLDGTVVNIALRSIGDELGATVAQLQWVVNAYLLSLAALILVGGSLGDHLGRKRIFMVGVAWFAVASAACGLAQTPGQLIAARLLQGVGAALLVPGSLALIQASFDADDRGRAIGAWSGLGGIAAAVGPFLGGWLIANVGWRWVFFINLPVGVLAYLGLLATMPESRNARASRFDFFGFTTLSVGVGCVQLLLDRGQTKDWFSSPEIVMEAVIGGLAFYLFIVHMFSSRQPFLNPALFKDRNFVASNVFILMIGVVLFATLALLPPMLQNQMQYPVILTGLVTMPRGIGTLLGMILVGRLIKHFDPRWVMALGLAFTAYALWQMTQFSLEMGSWPVIFSGIIQGAGVGLVYVPLSMVAFITLPSQLRNEGTSFFNLLRNLGSSVGISVVMFLLVQNTQRVHASLSEHITPFNIASNPAAAGFDFGSTSGLLAVNALITNQAAMIAYLDDFKLMMVLTILTIPFLFMIRNVKAAPGGTPVVAE